MVKVEETISFITKWLKSYNAKAGTQGFVVGVSGGIDSAVVSTLCAKTGAPTLVIEMPIHQAKDQVNRGQTHIKWLCNNFSNVQHTQLDLTSSYDDFVRSLEKVEDLHKNQDLKNLTLSNTRSRMRMTSLYAIAGLHGMLVCGTGNKVEDFGVGFYTKYGDGGVDLSPIANLMKSEVFALGKAMGVTELILNARPTDGLWDDGRTDEDQIGATYDELEWAMRIQMKEGNTPDTKTFGKREAEVWNIYLQRHKANLHKMNPIPVCELPEEFHLE